MERSERFFLLAIFFTAMIFFYILFLFFDPKGAVTDVTPEPDLPTSDYVDEEILEEASKDRYQFSKLGKLPPLGEGGGGIGPSRTAVRDRLERTSKEKLAAKLRRKGPALVVPLSIRQENMRKALLDRGYRNEAFLQMQALALEDKPYQQERTNINELIDQGRLEDATDLLEEVLYDIPEDNLQVRSLVLQKLLEVSLMSGAMDKIQKYQNQYFETTEKILNVYKGTQLMKYHEAREKIYKLEKAVQSGKSGSLMVFLQSVKSGRISPLEIVTGMKIAARNKADEGPFLSTNQDIEAAEKVTYSFFKAYTK